MRLSVLLHQVSLLSPPNRTGSFHCIRLSSFPLADQVKSCEQYIRSLHYVLLLSHSQSENLLAFAMWQAFPASDYYASSVAWSDFQALPP